MHEIPKQMHIMCLDCGSCTRAGFIDAALVAVFHEILSVKLKSAQAHEWQIKKKRRSVFS